MTRAAYYKWLNREIPVDELENQRIAEKIEEIHKESPDKGYRRIGSFSGFQENSVKPKMDESQEKGNKAKQ